jgi:23S rRNA (guanosine2251-2'-O)-methyltransferase
VDALIMPAKGSGQINSDAIKTSAGALYKLPVVRSQNLKETLRFLKDSGISIFAATEKAENDYTTVDYNKPMALILGSEGEGISEEYLKLTDATLRIPVVGEIESLNVSVASGVVLYEVMRQRNIK